MEELGLDPLFQASWKLKISDILKLWRKGVNKTGDSIKKRRLIQTVEVVGIIVSLTIKEKYTLFKVDDGSHVIDCILWKNRTSEIEYHERNFSADNEVFPDELRKIWDAANETEEFECGQLINVQGEVGTFRERPQIVCRSYRIETDIYYEAHHFAEVAELYTSHYNVPPAGIVSNINSNNVDNKSELRNIIQSKFITPGKPKIPVADVLELPEARRLFRENNVEANVQKDLVEEILHQLAVEGLLFLNMTNIPVYNTVESCDSLQGKVLTILDAADKENGWHHSKVYAELRKHLTFSKITKEAVCKVLQYLEKDSEVFSTKKGYYAKIELL